jgi:hypothetical protein
MATKTPIAPVTNDAEVEIDGLRPYIVEVEVEGTAAFLFHRWSVEAVAEKAKAAKGSAAKKSDNIESYVYRTIEGGRLAIPGEYFRQSIIYASKFRQDPRSPRKSAMDLFKAGVVSLDELCDLGVKDWDYLDQRRVMVQRNGITRVRPAMSTGWKVTVHLLVNLPEYIAPAFLHSILTDAGRLIGVGDFRPTYGRFRVTSFHEVEA